MDEPRAQRTLVKSPPELWAEISDAGALAGHLGAFGEIRITRLEPETTVAWEGDRARGTVELEPAGWGTKVTLTARMAVEPAAADPDPEAVAELEAAVEPAAVAEPESAEPVALAEPEATTARAEPEATAVPDVEPAALAPDAGPDASAPDPAAVEPEAPPPRPRRWWWPFARRRAVGPAPVPAPPGRDAPPAREEPAREEPAPGPAPAAAGPVPEPEVRPAPEAQAGTPETTPASLDARRAEEILAGVLDDLGAAHHRPFSRG